MLQLVQCDFILGFNIVYTAKTIRPVYSHSFSCSHCILTILYIFRGVRAIKGLFGSDSSKSTKFGTEVAPVILYGILIGASRGRHIGKIQNGRHPGEMSIAV